MIKVKNSLEISLTYRKSGFTLIEILTVVFLIGVVTLPFTNMFIFGVKGSHKNTDHVVGFNLARGKIEEVRALPFSLVKSDYENFREVFQRHDVVRQAQLCATERRSYAKCPSYGQGHG